jgi:hypothetical protein
MYTGIKTAEKIEVEKVASIEETEPRDRALRLSTSSMRFRN